MHVRRYLTLAVLAAAFGAPPALFAAPRTVVLSVPGMTCTACPITVRKALEKVPGVERVKVTYESKEAVVTFDDAKTDGRALIKATTEAGYPSTVKTR